MIIKIIILNNEIIYSDIRSLALSPIIVRSCYASSLGLGSREVVVAIGQVASVCPLVVNPLTGSV